MDQFNIANAIIALLKNKSVTFGNIEYETKVPTAAKYKHISITKRTTANVQLFSNIESDPYANAVKKSAQVGDFVASPNYFEHTECYSIVQHKTSGALYLYCIYNRAKATYFIEGAPATKLQVAKYLTPSAVEALLNPPAKVHNVTNGVDHNVIVRTIALTNIKSVTAVRQTVTF